MSKRKGGQIQHYVPDFYLSFFEEPQPKKKRNGLYVYDKNFPDRRPRETVARNVCSEPDFHAMVSPSGERDTSSREREMKVGEDAAAPILHDLGAYGAQISGEERERVAEFMATQHTRTRRVVEMLAAQAAKNMTNAAIEHLTDLIRSGQGSEQAMRCLKRAQQGELRIVVDPAKQVQAALDIALSLVTQVKEALLAAKWRFVDAPKGLAFITSDSPLTVFHRAQGEIGFGVGPRHKDAHVWFPICPRRGLYLSPHDFDLASLHVDSSTLALELNMTVARYAEHFIISGSETPQLATWTRLFASLKTYSTDPETSEDFEAWRAAEQGLLRTLPVPPFIAEELP